ncbi:DUF5985 family protein [Brevundimonas sp. Root1279]|uniref:DUF5985 family protein n=1 Tax=Brevundimonas sp. Root1279 TaxID=1736443 RepID=UPI0006F890DB|nr:DUF5985 family protein [Brevundimonas sp. Root1279]KQW78753.1 hypothetical protein ASC65_15670 [Brevundimonas sp. Root1279]
MSPASMITGAIIMGYAVAALFFLKFWRRTGDRLFLAFAAAFTLMAATPLLTGLLQVPREEQSPFYLLRLLAFLIIILAVIGKSRRAPKA